MFDIRKDIKAPSEGAEDWQGRDDEVMARRLQAQRTIRDADNQFWGSKGIFGKAPKTTFGKRKG